MRGPTFRVALAWLRVWALGALACGTFAVSAAPDLYKCRDASGKITYTNQACPPEPSPAASAPPPLACSLSDDRRRRADREEGQFLTRYPTREVHQAAEETAVRVRAASLTSIDARYREIGHERTAVHRELPFYERRALPPELQSRVDGVVARYEALRLAADNLRADLDAIRSRARCERLTFGKRWDGAAPGSSACDRPACAPP